MRDDPGLGRWPVILKDNRLTDQQLSGKQAPCPICGGSDRFRFDNKEDRGTWFCNKCGAGDGYILLMRLLDQDFKTIVLKVRETYGQVVPARGKVKPNSQNQLNKLWTNSVHDAPPLRAYMIGRGLPDEYACDAVLRFNQYTPWTDGERSGKSPAMLAKVYQNGKPVSLLRTFLSGGPTARKMMMTPIEKLDGCYIPLGGSRPGKIIGIAEGIETALACRGLQRVHDVPRHLVWAAYCADQLIKFRPPDGIEKVVIYGDNDVSFTGQLAAYRLAERLHREGYGCHVQIPTQAGTDWNDYLREVRRRQHDQGATGAASSVYVIPASGAH